jgi:hypothetical protein
MAETTSVSIRDGVKADKLHELTLTFLKELGDKSGNHKLQISSAARTPYDQALVMYENCLRYGLPSQYKLYGRNGDKVLKVFERMRKERKRSSEIIAAMYKEILRVGPSKVSKHCVNIEVMNVVDIPFSCITNIKKFRETLLQHKNNPIANFLDETNNSCFHIELNLGSLKNYYKAQ